MIQIDVSAKMRDQFGKGASRTLRRQGRTPAVLYGPEVGAMSLDLDCKGFTKSLLSLQRGNALFNITISDEEGGKSEVRPAIVKEVQVEPVNNTLVHADFMEISLESPMTFAVPIHYSGKAKGVDLGGEVHIMETTISLKGKVLDIPDSIDVDLGPLNVGDHIALSDLPVPASVSLIGPGTQACVSIIMPSKGLPGAEGAEAGSKGGTEAAE